jgi:hypothetical protein
MLIKFFHRGTASSDSALAYLLGQEPLRYLAGARDRRGLIRNPAPAVVKGSPELTRKLINNCRNKHRYVSGVLSFERLISKADEDLIIRKFEAVAFAGLRGHQFDCLWIRHSHLRRSELHFLVPRTELTTLKALNINPPRQRQEGMYDAFRKLVNEDFKLKDPSGLQISPPERARLETKLARLVEARATYNRSRYPVADQDRVLAPIHYEDRTGSPDRGVATPRRALSPPRPAARPALERLGSACRTLGQADQQLERLHCQRDGAPDPIPRAAVERFDRATRTIGQAGQQLERATHAAEGRLTEIVAQQERGLESRELFDRYNIPDRQPMELREHEREGMELELIRRNQHETSLSNS